MTKEERKEYNKNYRLKIKGRLKFSKEALNEDGWIEYLDWINNIRF